MDDWTDPKTILAHVQGLTKEQQLKLIETERKPRLSEAETKYLGLIERLKAWQEQEKAEREGKGS